MSYGKIILNSCQWWSFVATERNSIPMSYFHPFSPRRSALPRPYPEMFYCTYSLIFRSIGKSAVNLIEDGNV